MMQFGTRSPEGKEQHQPVENTVQYGTNDVLRLPNGTSEFSLFPFCKRDVVSSNLSTSTTKKPVNDRLFAFQDFSLGGKISLICGTGIFYPSVHGPHNRLELGLVWSRYGPNAPLEVRQVLALLGGAGRLTILLVPLEQVF
jgi:hypothetical protein